MLVYRFMCDKFYCSLRSHPVFYCHFFSWRVKLLPSPPNVIFVCASLPFITVLFLLTHTKRDSPWTNYFSFLIGSAASLLAWAYGYSQSTILCPVFVCGCVLAHLRARVTTDRPVRQCASIMSLLQSSNNKSSVSRGSLSSSTKESK